MKPFVVLLLATSASAQVQMSWTSTFSNGLSSSAGVRFENHTEPETPPLHFFGASSGRTIYRPQGWSSATHRYFHDDTNQTYVGYDLLIEQGPPPDNYRITFLELGIGPLDFAINPGAPVSPTGWKKLSTPPLPAPSMVHAGDKVEVPVWVDANTGQKLVDVIQIQPPTQVPMLQTIPSLGVMRSPMAVPRSGPTVPTVEGTARDFRADDAEMHLVQPRVTVNGSSEGSLQRTGNAATGTLVWFYLPKRGRYILSLVPRPELGFAKLGEVRGGAIQFKMDGDAFLVETYQPIAPGSAPYVLYVLHDKDWAPTAVNQSDHLLFGSVSPAELVALMKK